MLEVLIEKTEWNVNYKQPNHTYLVKGSKMLGYIVDGEVTYFTRPLSFEQNGRKFVKGDLSLFNDYKEPVNENIVILQGSKGNTYEINIEDQTCTCSAFKFRGGMCKHLKEVLRIE